MSSELSFEVEQMPTDEPNKAVVEDELTGEFKVVSVPKENNKETQDSDTTSSTITTRRKDDVIKDLREELLKEQRKNQDLTRKMTTETTKAQLELAKKIDALEYKLRHKSELIERLTREKESNECIKLYNSENTFYYNRRKRSHMESLLDEVDFDTSVLMDKYFLDFEQAEEIAINKLLSRRDLGLKDKISFLSEYSAKLIK